MTPIRVLMVCHGNICRSTMAEMVLKDMVRKRRIEDDFFIDSAATSREEIGNGVHYGTRSKLAQVGIPCEPHTARQMTKDDYNRFDYIIGMDSANIRNMTRIVGGDPHGKMHLLLSFAGNKNDIADPWYTGNFDATYRDVCEGCEALLEYLGY